MLQKSCHNFHSNCQNTFWIFENVSWGLSHSTRRGKVGQKPSSPWKQLFFGFSKMLVSIDLIGPKEMSLSFAEKLSNWLVVPLNFSPGFVTLDKTSEKQVQIFFHWNGSLIFFQKVAFSATSWVLKKWSYNLRHNCQRTLWSLTKCYSMSAINGIIRKNGPKTFFFGTIALHLKNLVLDFLGPREMILYLTHFLSEYIADSNRKLPEGCHTR